MLITRPFYSKVTTINLEDDLKLFFENNLETLAKHYPGLKWKRVQEEFSLNHIISEEELEQFLQKLKQGIPFEYISHQAYFFKDTYYVNEHVLIPRSETEILVEKALELTPKDTQVDIIDVGTGSGVIILAYLAEKKSKANAWASDIDEKALQVAKRNAQEKKQKVHFVQTDRLSNINQQFDIILANPPYIKKVEDKNKVHPQVLKYEPHRALFLDDDSYREWFNEFFEQIFNSLKKGGFSIIEGHEDHLLLLKDVAKRIAFSHVSLIQDYSGQNRFIYLRK